MNRREMLLTSAALPLLTGFGPTASRADDTPKRPRRGVNLCGAEFGVRPGFSNENPGIFGKDYTYNSEKTVAYFASRGVTLFRVPFRWERIQPRLNEPLDPAELARLTEFLGWVRSHGCAAILDIHNYGRFCIQKGDKPVEAVVDAEVGGEVLVSRDHFADLWRRLSSAFRGDATIHGYGLMNEPHNMGTSDWKLISQSAVDAIRSSGDATLILVPGDSWSSALRWPDANGTHAWIKDSANHHAYEAHSYWDQDQSGEYKSSYDDELAKDKSLASRAVRRLIPFAGWCSVNRVPGFLGEFGVPGDDPRWLSMLGEFVSALDRSGLEGTYWAAGEWWGSYKLSMQPRDGKDAAQMNILTRA